MGMLSLVKGGGDGGGRGGCRDWCSNRQVLTVAAPSGASFLGAGSGWLAAVATSVVVVMEWNG